MAQKQQYMYPMLAYQAALEDVDLKPKTELAWVQSHKELPGKTGFLDLPREIRDLCYYYGMTVSGAIFIFSPDPTRPTLKGRIVRFKDQGPSEPQRVQDSIPIGLVRTCRQIHTESTEVLYDNIFQLYTTRAPFATSYRSLVHHITFTMEAGRNIYSEDMDVMSYWWRRVFWPNIVDHSKNLLHRYPNLESLTFPMKSNQIGQTWRPAFLAFDQKTRQQRVALAARWLKLNCPFTLKEDQLRQILHLEVLPAAGLPKDIFIGSRFFPDDDEDGWDVTELADAFEMMKML